MNKVIRDGKVAVLVSPGYGAGWYSWHGIEELLYDPVVVEMVERDAHSEIEAYVDEVYGDAAQACGAEDLVVAWIPEGARFRVHEYDGSESLILESREVWHIA